MFAVDGLEDVVARLDAHGGGIVGEAGQYQDMEAVTHTTKAHYR